MGFLLLSSCAKERQDVRQEVLTDGPELSRQACYASLKGGDTVRLTLDFLENDSVNGQLSYKFLEKDHNTGTLTGRIKGDTLLAHYVYSSEGQISEREVAFLLKDNLILEGYGEQKEENGVLRFINFENLQYGNGFILLKVNCGNNKM